jgi:hypothetical protein
LGERADDRHRRAEEGLRRDGSRAAAAGAAERRGRAARCRGPGGSASPVLPRDGCRAESTAPRSRTDALLAPFPPTLLSGPCIPLNAIQPPPHPNPHPHPTPTPPTPHPYSNPPPKAGKHLNMSIVWTAASLILTRCFQVSFASTRTPKHARTCTRARRSLLPFLLRAWRQRGPVPAPPPPPPRQPPRRAAL